METIGYAADADLYCDECKQKIYGDRTTDNEGNPIHPVFESEESDNPMHCGNFDCGVLLGGNLTTEGRRYVCEAIVDHLASGGQSGSREVVEEWAEYYGIDLAELFDFAKTGFRHKSKP